MRISSEKAARRALRGTAAALMGLALCGSAWALSLGRITLQSARGEPLRAEVELGALSPEEAASLRARIAPAEAFSRAGAGYSAVLDSAEVELALRSNGQSVLRIRSDRVVQESFLDLILEIDWASGRARREYTLLFDASRSAAEAAAASAAAAPLLGAAPTEPGPARPSAEAASAATPSARDDSASGRYVVRRGDTLSGVAARMQASGVSLEQMLVALYRGNPHAFIGQNMNRLRADTVLRLPTPEQARQVARGEARQVVRLQSADFNAYRQRLAQSAPAARVEESARRSGGAVEAPVEERRAGAAAPDRLKLSRAPSGAAPEAKLAREAEQRDQTQRMTELSRNVEDLRRLAASAPTAGRATTAPAPASAPAAEAPASKPAAPVAAEVASAPASAAPASVAAASAAAPASAPELAASAASAVADAGLPAPAAASQASTGFMGLLARSWALFLGGAVALLALLVLGFVHWRRRQKTTLETSFLESRLQPESFFSGSGAQRADARESGASVAAASDDYSLSQLDAIGDVDPVAEADVYLAYGRDLQAEEILKEALRSNPQRLAIRTKLLEVYAKRHDVKAFELLAQQLHQITQGQGEDWDKARELGLQIDPDNPLYGEGEAAADSRAPATQAPSTWLPTQPPATEGAPAAARLDLDLDLLASAPAQSRERPRPQVASTLPPELPDLADLDLPAPSAMPHEAATASAAAASSSSDLPGDSLFGLDATPAPTPAPDGQEAEEALPELDFGVSELPSEPVRAPQPPAASPSLPFDLDSLSLDLDEPSTTSMLDELHITGFGEEADPLERKLELAEEFRQIGDADGARDLLQEVLSQASGPLKARAQGMLDSLV